MGSNRNSKRAPGPAQSPSPAASQKAAQNSSSSDHKTPKPQSGNEKLKVNTGNTSATTHDAPDAQGAGPGEPQLPITPKSPLPALHDDTNEKVSPPRNAAVQQDMTAVDELLITMKRMLGTLGSTFDLLGEQTIKVATLPIAIDAMHQVSRSSMSMRYNDLLLLPKIASLKHEFERQQHRQDAKMDDLKTVLLDQVKARLYTGLKETASGMVKEVISKLVANRVRSQVSRASAPRQNCDNILTHSSHELSTQISQSVRDDAISCKAQITEARIRLLNS